MMTKSTNEMLAPAINLRALFKSQPDLFDLSSLFLEDKVRLLKSEPDIFCKKIRETCTILNDRISILCNVKSKVIQKEFALSNDEIKDLSSKDYMRLVHANFKKYISIEKYNTLTNSQKDDVLYLDPEWVFDNAFVKGNLPKLTLEQMCIFSKKCPSIFDTYSIDISKYSTNRMFWERMIVYNKKYEDVFIKNTKSLITKTDVRAVCRRFPHLIKELNAEILENSKLTAKEWILLSKTIMKSNTTKFKDWTFSDDMKDLFKLDLTVELLNGKSKLSTHLQGAMKSVFGEGDGDSDEDEVVIREDEY